MVVKIRKVSLRIIFLIAIKDFCFKQVHKYARIRKQELGHFRVHLKQFWHFQRVNTK